MTKKEIIEFLEEYKDMQNVSQGLESRDRRKTTDR